jgi:hypothetical protein
LPSPVGAGYSTWVTAKFVDGDPFKIVFDRDDVVIAKRVVSRK